MNQPQTNILDLQSQNEIVRIASANLCQNMFCLPSMLQRVIISLPILFISSSVFLPYSPK